MNTESRVPYEVADELFVGLDDPLVTDLDHPHSLWNQAAGSTRQADPFCCRSEWQLSFAQSRNPDGKLLIRQSKDGLIAFSRHVLPVPAGAQVLTPVDNQWMYGNPLLGKGGIDLLDDLVRDFLHFPGYSPVIVISGLRPDGGLLKGLRVRFQLWYHFKRLHADVLCGASLSQGMDGYLSRRSANQRRNLRKQSRRAAGLGIAFERFSPTTEHDVVAIYRRMIKIERASWKGAGHCGMAEPFPRRYYLNMLRRLAVSGSARIILARHGERDIGFIFGGLINGIYRGQQFSFDQQWQKHSIGNLMQMQQITWLCEEGARRYDLGPLMGYKHHWAELRSHIEAWAMIPR